MPFVFRTAAPVSKSDNYGIHLNISNFLGGLGFLPLLSHPHRILKDCSEVCEVFSRSHHTLHLDSTAPTEDPISEVTHSLSHHY